MDISQEEKQRIREKIEKLKSSKFKQQSLPSWRPVPTVMSAMITFAAFGVIFLSIGIILLIMSQQVFEIVKRYDDVCQGDLRTTQDCKEITIQVDKLVQGPIYVYYGLTNFYQNHRRYVKSRDNQQLNGQYKEISELGSCDPIITMMDLWENQKVMLSGERVTNERAATLPAIPCGLVAKSFFNDTFALYKCHEDDCTANPDKHAQIIIREDGIAWSSDVEAKYENIQQETLPPGGPARDYRDVQWKDMKDEHFIVWMRTAGLPNFRKLWGRIDGVLEPGLYQLQLKNNFEVQPFQGTKSFVLTTTNSLGGNNYFLSVVYIIVGSACMFLVVLFGIYYIRKRNINMNYDEKF